MYEGAAGCYGALTDALNEEELWIDSDTCSEKEFGENEMVSLEVTSILKISRPQIKPVQ